LPDFHWQTTATASLVIRFPAQTIGRLAWQQLVDQLAVRAAGFSPAALRQIFEQFLQQAGAPTPVPVWRQCRVFVSHRRSDVKLAERIAWLATQAGYGYWLDVHDPVLSYMGTQGQAIPSPIRDVLIAAIIEIGLLNASHVIAVMSAQSAGSKWIPYEFGRAKDRRMHSPNAASWIHPGVTLADCGEYVQLAEITSTENEILGWLNATPAGYCALPAHVSWSPPEPPSPSPEPDPLPTSP
jgi:hypothetical protein